MNAQIISINNLTKSFDKTDVLKNISADVHAGEIIALLGLNGAGKTTLLETLLGFCLPDQGSIKLFGHETRVLTDQNVKKRIGFVPQEEELLPTLRVDHYLDLIGTFYPKWDEPMVSRLCTEWQLPVNKMIRVLSPGQRQKVAIISAIGFHPDLLILDEPVANLDPQARRQFLSEIIKIADHHHCTILFSTHIVSDVERIADRLWLLRDGQLIMDEAIDEIKERTVRLHLPATADVKSLIEGLNTINIRHTSQHSVLTVSGWSEQCEKRWRAKLATGFLIEPLSLEDIFLEMSA